MLNRLRCQPEVVDADVRIAASLLELRSNGAEYLGSLYAGPQLWFAAEPA